MEEEHNTIEEVIKNSLPQNKKEWTYLIIVVALVVTTCLIGFYYFLEIKYDLELLQSPCDLCSVLEMNHGTYEGVNWTDLGLIAVPTIQYDYPIGPVKP